MFSNRDLSILIWFGVLTLVLVVHLRLRGEAWWFPARLVSSFAEPTIILTYAAVLLYVTCLVLGAWAVGLWRPALLKDTIVWFIGTGLGLPFTGIAVVERRSSLHILARRAFHWAVVVEFFVGVYVFSLAVELVLVPILMFIPVFIIFAEASSAHANVVRVLNGVMVSLGLGIVAYVAVRVADAIGFADVGGLLRGIALPVWLTLGTLPIVYCLAIYLSFDRVISHLKDVTHARRARWSAYIALTEGFVLRVADLHDFRGNWPDELAAAASLADAREVVGRYFASLREAEEARIEAEDRLRRYAGVDGVDEYGFRLDQREFNATKMALQWLATAQLGWYQERGGRYRPELLDMLAPAFVRHGLPSDHGIHLFVAEDGQSWWAWRRTISGWCFAIGNADPLSADGPPAQWLFDGRNPPAGFPGQDACWGGPWGAGAANW